jgi:hypothetical protein
MCKAATLKWDADVDPRFARVRRLGMAGLQMDDYFVAFGGAWYTILCVAFNQMLTGGGSNLLTDDEIATLTPESIEARIEGSKWVFVSEHAMLLTIWSMKAAMLCLYARITSGSNLVQRRLLKGVAGWVVLAFIGDELALFLICRPVQQYWAVPAENGKQLSHLDEPATNVYQPNARLTNTIKSSMQFSISPRTS